MCHCQNTTNFQAARKTYSGFLSIKNLLQIVDFSSLILKNLINQIIKTFKLKIP